MLVLMGVNLYASRVVINALGVEDYGLYSVVGSVVIFMGFVNNSMTAASQRFLAYTKGGGSVEEQNSMFCSVSASHILIAVILFLLGETLGVLYIENYLNVAPDKYAAAHWVFQFSLASLLMKTITVPYHASIIANEKMTAFAYISLIEGGLQLFAALMLSCFSADRVVFYAALMFLSVFATQSAYIIYSRLHFAECQFARRWKGEDVKHIFSYSGWNLLGAFSGVASSQGVNMLLNFFAGVVVNAARGVAFQVEAAITSLSGNFQSAINPQVVKNYAAKDLGRMHMLIMTGTRFSFFLLLIFAAPIFVNMEEVLTIWLKIVPEYAVGFCKLMLVYALIASLSALLLTGAMATGRIKKYQIIVAGINLLNLPLSYLVLKLNGDPYMPFFVLIMLAVIAFVARLTLVSQMISLSKRAFAKEVLQPIAMVMIVLVLVLAFYCSQNNVTDSVLMLILKLGVTFTVTIAVIMLLGVKKTEREMVVGFIKKKINAK